jgi:YHS domain-containing protein
MGRNRLGKGRFMRFKSFIFAGLTAVTATIASPAPAAFAADKAPVYTSWKNNIALGGYDAVSFFKSKPLEGQTNFSLLHKGAEWRFSSEANRDLFKANPDAFEPQYGGYCAWAIAGGKLAKGSPKYWHIDDGRLYLNYNGKIKDRWIDDKASFITAGDEKWPKILVD